MPPITILGCNRSGTKALNCSDVRCPLCGDRFRHKKHGFYERYLPGTGKLIGIQRFRCLRTDCRRVTFSILPWPCLPFKQETLAFLTSLVQESIEMPHSWLADLLDKGWTALKRLVKSAVEVTEYLEQERYRQIWGPCPCRNFEEGWTAFTQSMSWALFTRRR